MTPAWDAAGMRRSGGDGGGEVYSMSGLAPELFCIKLQAWLGACVRACAVEQGRAPRRRARAPHS